MLGRQSSLRLKVSRIHFFRLLKKKSFAKAFKVIDDNSPGINKGVDLENLSSILSDSANWLPTKKNLYLFIDFLNSITQQKQYNMAFNLGYGLAETFQKEADASLVFAQICIDRRLLGLAEKYSFAAHEMKKEDFRVLNCCGIVLLEKGEIDRAKSFFLKAIEISPQSPQSYLNISNAYLYLNEYEACEKSLEKAISINPRYIPAQVHFAQFVLVFKKDTKKFLRILETLQKIDPYEKSIAMLKYQYSRFKDHPDKMLNEWLQKCLDESSFPF